MTRPLPALERVATAVAYLLFGAVATAAIALALLYAARPIQAAIYGAFYLSVGPSEATQAAVLTHFLASGAAAIAAATAGGDLLGARLEHRSALLAVAGALALLVVAFLAVSLAGLAAFPVALVGLVAAAVAVALLLRYRYGVRSGALPAFVGGIPVLVALLLLAGFGLGWGWGYVMTAQAVPAAAVNGSAAVDFDDAPDVRDDLFDPENCSTGVDGRRVCRLYLRGYEREVRAVRFMARHGVRCPYVNARDAGRADAFVARYGGSYYRVTCVSHGD